ITRSSIYYNGITERFNFESKDQKISVEIVDKKSSKIVALFTDISPFFPFLAHRTPFETLGWFIAQGYSVRLVGQSELYLMPGLLGGNSTEELVKSLLATSYS